MGADAHGELLTVGQSVAPAGVSYEVTEPPWVVLRRAARAVHPTQRVQLASLALTMVPPGQAAHLHARLDLAEALLSTGRLAESAVIAEEVRAEATRADLVVRALSAFSFAVTGTSGAADILPPLDLDAVLDDFAGQPADLLDDLGSALIDYALGELHGGHALRARRTADAALRCSGSDRVRVGAGMVKSFVALFDGDLDDALSMTQAFMRVFGDSAHQYDLIAYGPWTVEVNVLTAAGLFDQALASAARGKAAAALVGLPGMEARGATAGLVALLESGRWDEMLAAATHPILYQNRLFEGLLHGCVALAHARCGNSDEADASLLLGAGVGSTIHCGWQYLLWARATRARLHNDFDGSIAAFRLLSSIAQDRHVSVGWPSLIFDAARTEWTHGDRTVARWWLSTLPRSTTAPYAIAFQRGAAALVRDNHLELEVAATLLSADAPFETAKLCIDAARSARLAGERTIARRLFGRAMKILIRLGAAGELVALEQELHATGLTPSVPRVVPGGGATELTEAERRVVGLVREGYSNKDIAVRLGVSIRTVETHLSRVYAKLGVGSRLQLATRRPETSPAY